MAEEGGHGGPDRTLCDELAAELPDRPRWVETRGLLLSGRCEILLGPEGRRGAGWFVLDRARPAFCVAVHRPVASLVERLRREHPQRTEILAHWENVQPLAALLEGWVARPATIHVHPDPASLPDPRHEVRELLPADLGSAADLPPAVAHELSVALRYSRAAAAFAEGRPVAFCSAAYETETWWDVWIDTLPAWRRRGYGSSAAAFLIQRMLADGKQPVWGALDANRASLAMAARYGFRAVDRIALFTPRSQALGADAA